MKKPVNILAALVCCYAVLLVSSCSDPWPQAGPVKIGINEWAGYDPFILANEIGLFEKNSVQVEIIRFVSATEEIQALRDGKIQAAGITLDEAFTLVESGFKGKIILIVDYSTGGDMVIGQRDIKSIADLKGRVIGYEGTVVGEFLLHRALQDNAIKRGAVKLVGVKADEWLSAFKERKVDALVCFNPVATILIDEYEGNVLYSSADMPFEIIDVLFVSESFYNDNRPAMANILRAWFDTLIYIDTNPEKAAEVVSTAKNITPENYKKSLEDLVAPDLKANRSVMDPRTDKNIYKYSQVVANFMISQGLLSKSIRTSDLFRPDILLEIDTDPEPQ